MHRDLGQVLLVFGGWTGRGAHHVSEVEWREPRHHSVEVDDTDSFAGAVVEHHVIELGVVVGHAFGKLRIEYKASDGLALKREVDLRAGKVGAVRQVTSDGSLQCGETAGSVVKVGDGIVQARRGQIGEQALEMAECFGGLISLCGRFNDVVRAGMLDEAVGAPVVAEWVGVPGAGVARGDEGEGAAVAVGFGREFCGEVGGDALDVLASARQGRRRCDG